MSLDRQHEYTILTFLGTKYYIPTYNFKLKYKDCNDEHRCLKLKVLKAVTTFSLSFHLHEEF